MSGRAKFWLASLLCILVVGFSLGNYYEILRKQAKDRKNELKETSINSGYIFAKNKSDVYGFSKKFSGIDQYDFSKIKKYWDAATVMYRVPYCMFKYHPNVRSPAVNTNNSGFRGKYNFSYLASFVPDSKYRYIVLLGGSTAFGAYSSSDDKCISAILESKLNSTIKTSKPFRVINLGMGFYNSFQELITYILYGIKFNPEFVVTFDGFNDSAVPLMQHKEVPLVNGLYYQTKGLIDVSNKKSLGKKYKEYSKYFISENGVWDEESPNYIYDVSQLYKRNLGLICLISKEKKTKVLLTLQPVKIFPDGKFAWESKEVETIYKLLPDVLKELSLEYGVSYLDFQRVFRENISFNQYFVGDPVHLNDRGQEIIATYIFEELKKEIAGN